MPGFIRPIQRTAIFATLLGGLAVSAPAQIVGTGKPVAGQINSGATITLDVSDRPLDDVLEHIRTKVGVSIVTTPGADGRVTINLRDIPWKDALDLVAENAGCIVKEESVRLYKVEKPERVTMAFTGTEIKQVIEAIAKAGNANIIVKETVTGSVTMVLKDQPWRDALEAVVKTSGYHVVEEDRGILRVVDDSGLSTHLERKMFHLKYLRPKDTYVAKIDTLYAEGGTKAATGEPMKDFPLLEALSSMLTPSEGELRYFADQNAILVRDTKPRLDEIGRFIENLDIEPVQVYIDVKFVATNNTDTGDYSFGFDNGLSASLTGAARTSRFPFNLGPGSFAQNLLPGRRGDNITQNPSNLNPTFFGNTGTPVAPGLLDFSATSVAIRLLKSDINAEMTQRPSLITLNDKPATIFVGETVRYAEADAQSNQSGGLQLTVKEASASPVQTGFQLLVIPHVVPGTNKIIMTVVPESETLTGATDPNLPGFDLFSVGAGTGTGSISLPRIGSQTVVTTMMLENGQTGIVGGLRTTDKRKEVNKVPLLGDIPGLGWLFKSQNNRDDERGVLVFLTPWIVQPTEQADESLQRTIDQIKTDAADEWESMLGDLGV